LTKTESGVERPALDFPIEDAVALISPTSLFTVRICQPPVATAWRTRSKISEWSLPGYSAWLL
jgi:hypothetical protein